MSYSPRHYAAVHAAVKQHFMQHGRTEAQWAVVNNNPQLFNRVWRNMLGWPPGDTPPIAKRNDNER